jgi:transcriptional regulator with XRE-family HTH domain
MPMSAITVASANGRHPLVVQDDDALTWVRVVRLARGMTPHELADAAGVNIASLSRIERGHRHPQPTTLRCLAAALDVPEAMLFPDAPPPMTLLVRYLDRKVQS